MARDRPHHLTRLSSVEAYKLRIGDYRAIVDVNWDGEIPHVFTAGHQGTVYR